MGLKTCQLPAGTTEQLLTLKYSQEERQRQGDGRLGHDIVRVDNPQHANLHASCCCVDFRLFL
jgi:hypothetical protein